MLISLFLKITIRNNQEIHTLATWQTITLISRKILAINNYSSQSNGSCLHRWNNIRSGQMDSEGYSLHFEHFQWWKCLLVSWLTGIHNQIFRLAVPCKQMPSKIHFSETWTPSYWTECSYFQNVPFSQHFMFIKQLKLYYFRF